MAYYPMQARVQATKTSEDVYYFRCNQEDISAERLQFIKNQFGANVGGIVNTEENIPINTGDLITFDEGITWNRVENVTAKPKPTNRSRFNRGDYGIRKIYIS